MTLSLVLSLVSLVLTCGIGVLHLVAPLTKTTVDDAILARLEAVEKFVDGLVGASSVAKTPEVPKT